METKTLTESELRSYIGKNRSELDKLGKTECADFYPVLDGNIIVDVVQADDPGYITIDDYYVVAK